MPQISVSLRYWDTHILAVLFTIARKRGQHRCLPTNKQILWCTYTVVFYVATKRKVCKKIFRTGDNHAQRKNSQTWSDIFSHVWILNVNVYVCIEVSV